MVVKMVVQVLFFLLLMISYVSAAGDAVTPYGDYCRECAAYGACKNVIPPGKAMKAMIKYYHGKGCRVGTVQHKGRFIEAEVYRQSRQVDKVIFDRKTGRLRSIY